MLGRELQEQYSGPRGHVYVAIEESAGCRRAVRAAVAVADKVHEVPMLDEVEEQSEVDEPRVIIVGLRMQGRELSPSLLRAFRRRDPVTSIILCVTAGDRAIGNVAGLCRAGVDGLVVFHHGQEDDSELVKEIDERLMHALAPPYRDALAWTDRSRGAFEQEWVARNAWEPLDVVDIADHFSLSPKTVCRDLKVMGWKDAKRALDGGRLLHLGAVLNDDRVTLEQAAEQLAFGSGSAVSHFVRRVTRRTAAGFREDGAIDAATVHWTSRGHPGPRG